MFENDGLKIFFHNLVIFLAKYECSNGAMVDTYGAVVGGLSNQGPFLWFCGHDMACPRTPSPCLPHFPHSLACQGRRGKVVLEPPLSQNLIKVHKNINSIENKFSWRR